ncbi:EH domain-containing protein 1 isoform X8 [Gossypium hirsutum]|uniref:EH domain-containing protein 1 isoform X8 n=1 Tax=Gossypium hirsutum TaxID=3635 RepID=A0A1U8JR89_GOSHI|nr:EH domain-containing protein 1 isoform X8 [Gossypium hirsutum]
MMDALLEMMQSSLLVWTTADSKRQGFLGFKEFVFAMQLVSLVQEGHQISHDLLNGDVDFENIRPPVMEGLDTLIMRKKQSSKSSSLESNGSSSNQTSPASQLFSSKSSKKNRYLCPLRLQL